MMNSVLRSDPVMSGVPDARGRYGAFGGRYVPETLVPALDRLQTGVERYLHDAEFLAEFNHELKSWVGRPTALSHAPTLSKRWGAQVWLNAKILRTRAPIRSITPWAKFCWRGAWAPSASSRKPVRASTVSRAPPRPHGWECPAWSTWARSTWSGNRPTSDACSSSGPPVCR